MVDKVFGAAEVRLEELPSMLEFPLRRTTTVGELQEFYDIQMDARPESTLDELIRSRLGPKELKVGSMVQFAQIALHVRGLTANKTVDRVGMVILPQPEPAPVEVEETSTSSSPPDGIV